MDDYSRYQQSKGRYNDPPARGAPQQYGYDPRLQAPPPRGASSRGGGPDSYDRAPSNSLPSYRGDPGDRDRRELFGDRGAQQGKSAPRGGYDDGQYAGQQDSRYGGGRDVYGDSNSRYGAQQNQSRGDYDAYGDSRFARQEDDEEVDRIKQQIKFTNQDTLASTRNALNKIREAEEMGGQTLARLGQQSEQLGNVNRNLDAAKAYSDRAVDKAGELKQLQRSMFMPVIKNPFNKKKREQREIDAARQDHKEHAATIEEIRQYEYESQQRLANLDRQHQRQQYGNDTSKRSERDTRYQFEADAEDDAVEDEIESNMDALSAATGRLKNMALTMNGELESQNSFLANTDKKVAPLSEKIATTTYRINKIK